MARASRMDEWQPPPTNIRLNKSSPEESPQVPNPHTEFWLRLLELGDSPQERKHNWNSYFKWRYPNRVSSAIRSVRESEHPLVSQFPDIQCGKETQALVERLANEVGGEPPRVVGDSPLALDLSGVPCVPNSFAGRILFKPSFSASTFPDGADFTDALVIGTADFSDISFQYDVDFEGAYFQNTVQFRRAQFAGSVFFHHTTFNFAVYFNDARFTSASRQNRATHEGVGFRNASVRGEASFSGVDFSGKAIFDSMVFGDDATFLGACFHKSVDFGRAEFHRTVSFKEATFLGSSNFNDASFKAQTSFQGAILKSPPRFFGTELHEDTDFENVDWRRAESSYRQGRGLSGRTEPSSEDRDTVAIAAGDAARVWDRLALIMSRLERSPERHEFHRLRLRAQRARDGLRFPTVVNWLFDLSSEYGWNVSRAFICWFGHIAFFACFLFLASCRGCPSASWAPLLLDCLLTSFSNSHSFLGLASEGGYLDAATSAVKDSGIAPSLLNAIGVVQAIVGPILLFLVLLALRNRYRLG